MARGEMATLEDLMTAVATTGNCISEWVLYKSWHLQGCQISPCQDN